MNDIIKQLGQVNNALQGIKDMKSDLTKLLNSFANFKMEIVYKINQIEESVKLCSDKHNELNKLKVSFIQRLDELKKENDELEIKLTKAVALIDD